ncbi:hypothetical protein Tco_0792812 [Tanacetum coccineum]
MIKKNQGRRERKYSKGLEAEEECVRILRQCQENSSCYTLKHSEGRQWRGHWKLNTKQKAHYDDCGKNVLEKLPPTEKMHQRPIVRTQHKQRDGDYRRLSDKDTKSEMRKRQGAPDMHEESRIRAGRPILSS